MEVCVGGGRELTPHLAGSGRRAAGRFGVGLSPHRGLRGGRDGRRGHRITVLKSYTKIHSRLDSPVGEYGRVQRGVESGLSSCLGRDRTE